MEESMALIGGESIGESTPRDSDKVEILQSLKYDSYVAEYCSGAGDSNASWNVAKFTITYYKDRSTLQGKKQARWVLFPAGGRRAIGKIVVQWDAHRAHIESLHIDHNWRGFALSAVLFRTCMHTLQQEGVQVMYLDAEEDVARHGKLVHLYNQWGFQQCEAKIQYLYNDTETFRKVPMNLFLDKSPFHVMFGLPDNTQFSMLKILNGRGVPIVSDESGTLSVADQTTSFSYWQVLFLNSRFIHLRSYYGKFMCADTSGHLVANRPRHSTWETFMIASHADGVVLRTIHKTFLGINENGQIIVSHSPCVWSSNGCDLIGTEITSEETCGLMYFQASLHTRDFVVAMTQKYREYPGKRLSIEASIRELLHIERLIDPEDSSIIKRMIGTGNHLKALDHPDWMQLTAFIHCLGLLLLRWIDNQTDETLEEGEATMERSILRLPFRMWLYPIEAPSWVIGTPLNEPMSNDAALEDSTMFGDYPRHCGIQNTLLTWTPDEYLYHTLKKNQTSLPEEAFDMIRFRSCVPWHSSDAYDPLMTEEDYRRKEMVQTFVGLLEVPLDALDDVQVAPNLSYYIRLAKKYLGDTIEW